MFLEREILNPNKKNCLSKPYIVGPFPLFIKGEWDFSKIAVMEGNKNFLLEFGGKPGMVRGRGRWEIFKVSLHSLQKGLNALFYEYPHPISPTSLFKILSNPSLPPLPCNLQPPAHSSFCCPVSLDEWVFMPHLMCYFT